MSTFQIRDLPAKATLDGSELIELQEAAGGAGSSKQAPAGAFLPPDYISGLKMVWNSANSLSVTSGAAYISSLGRVVRLGATANLAGLVLTASTWYHLYLYLNAGAPAIECVTTAPAAAYFGTARAKTGDTSRRYVGSVKTDASGNIYKFVQTNSDVMYEENVINAPFNILNNGTATTPTNVDASGIVPLTSSVAYAQFYNSSPNTNCGVANPDCNFTLSVGGAVTIFAITPGLTTIARAQLSSAQLFNYQHSVTPSSGGMTIRVIGYTFER